MNIDNGIVFSFTTKHPCIKTILRVDILQVSSDKLFAYSWDKNFLILVKVLKWLLDILHRLFICFVNLSLSPMVIPRSFTSLVYMFIFHKSITLLWSIDDLGIIWNFAGLATRLLILNQFRTIYMSD